MRIFNHMNTNPNTNTITSNIKPFFVTAYFKKSKYPTRLFMNNVSTYQNIPYDCRLSEISCYFYDLQNLDFRITLNVRINGKITTNKMQGDNIQLSKNDILWIEIFKKGTRKEIIQDEAVFSIVFFQLKKLLKM